MNRLWNAGVIIDQLECSVEREVTSWVKRAVVQHLQALHAVLEKPHADGRVFSDDYLKLRSRSHSRIQGNDELAACRVKLGGLLSLSHTVIVANWACTVVEPV